MIKSIIVTNYLGESKEFELARPEKSGFAIKNIDGLEPSDSDIITTEIITNDGSMFNSARTKSRNIVIEFDFRYANDVQEARLESYKYFPNKKQCKLLIKTDKRNCVAYGYVESNKALIFSENTTATISIICPDPYLYSEFMELNVFSGIIKLFEFPFSNESLTDKNIEIGEVVKYTTKDVVYKGDAETGIIITIHTIGEAKNISIHNVTTKEKMIIDTDKLSKIIGSGIVAGDDIIISTIDGNKTARLFRNGEYTNILNCINRDADWFKLSKGLNTFAYQAEFGASNIEFQIEYQTLYEGV